MNVSERASHEFFQMRCAGSVHLPFKSCNPENAERTKKSMKSLKEHTRKGTSQEPTDRSDRIARHTFTIFLTTFATGTIRYVYKISMARMLGVRGYGLLSAVEPLFILTASLFLSGFAVGLSKYLSEEIARSNKKRAESYLATTLYYVFPLSVGAALLIFAASQFIAETLFHEPELGILIRIVVVAVPLEALWIIFDGIFLGYQESPYFTYSLFVYQVMVLSGALFLVKMGMGTEGAVTALVIGDASGLTAAYLFYRKKFKDKISFHAGEKSFTFLKNLIGFAVPKTITSVSIIILMSFDIFCITYFLGATFSGVYNAAVPIARMIPSVSTSICLPLLPAVSEDFAREKQFIQKYLADAVKYISAATIPLVILCTVYARQIIGLLFGPSYTTASHALMILAVAMLFMAYTSIFSVTFQGMGDPTTPMRITVFAVVFNVLLNSYLIPRIGIDGAAVSTLVSMGVTCGYLWVRIREYADYSDVKGDILKIGGLSLVMLLIVVACSRMFLLGTLLGLGLYGGSLIALKIIDIKKFLPTTGEL